MPRACPVEFSTIAATHQIKPNSSEAKASDRQVVSVI
jgi:hypothetical protein